MLPSKLGVLEFRSVRMLLYDRQSKRCTNTGDREPHPLLSDPGFPIGGVDLVRGGVDSRGSYVLKILYVETKESGPLGERPPMYKILNTIRIIKIKEIHAIFDY